MAINEIPLSPDNQLFSLLLAGTEYQLRILWRDPYWVMDLSNAVGDEIILGIPLVNGVNLLSQYQHQELGFQLVLLADNDEQDPPDKFNLGLTQRLYVITE